MWMRARFLLALAGHTDQRAVERMPGHVVGIGVGTAIEQHARDRNGIVTRGLER